MMEDDAKLLALMQTTLSGTIFVYQGEEIGMRNMPKDWDVAEYKDIESINYWKKSLKLRRKRGSMVLDGDGLFYMRKQNPKAEEVSTREEEEGSVE